MKTRGKHANLWQKTRKEWIRLNPPNHQGYYVCWMCGRWVPASEMELDHVQARSRHPERRYDLTNLRPSCHKCNSQKGSTEFVIDDLENLLDL